MVDCFFFFHIGVQRENFGAENSTYKNRQAHLFYPIYNKNKLADMMIKQSTAAITVNDSRQNCLDSIFCLDRSNFEVV